MKARIATAKAAFNKKTLFTSKLDLELRKKLVKCYIWSIALYGVETWTLRKLDQKYLENVEMWCWRRMEMISWTNRVNNEAVLHRLKEERNILHTIRQRKANWIEHILCRNCLLSRIIEGKIGGTRRRGRRRKQLLDDLKEARRYWKLEEAQDRTLWRTQFGRGYGPVARQTTRPDLRPLSRHIHPLFRVSKSYLKKNTVTLRTLYFVYNSLNADFSSPAAYRVFHDFRA
jgi:hypothetical protein